MTVGQILTVVHLAIVVLTVAFSIGFSIWWNRMERKKDKIMTRYKRTQYELLMSVLLKDEEDA